MALLTKRQLSSSVPVDLSFSVDRYSRKSASASLREKANAPKDQKFDVFLSHSYADTKLLDADDFLRLRALLQDQGLSVYVDWIDDRELDRGKVTAATAARLRHRLQNCRSLLYVTSESASKSRWMPWELGYSDGKFGRVAILPIDNSYHGADSFHGQEYLGIYPYVTYSNSTSGKMVFWVEDGTGAYVSLKRWVEGAKPFKRLRT